MVEKHMFHIPVGVLNHDDHMIIVVRKYAFNVFPRKGDLGPYTIQKTLRAFKGVMYAANICRAYHLWAELYSLSQAKPPAMVLVFFLELSSSIPMGRW